MASDNWKQEAWVRFATAAMMGEDDRATHAASTADSLLALMEQREREGRFGPAGGGDEIQRLRVALEGQEGKADCESERADKAESLLKEALTQLRDAAVLYTPKSIGREDIDGLLARARQEGFSDGE